MDLCPARCECPICGNILSNQMMISPPDMKVYAFCVYCKRFVPMDNLKIINIEDEVN